MHIPCKFHWDCSSRSWDIVLTRPVRTNGQPENITPSPHWFVTKAQNHPLASSFSKQPKDSLGTGCHVVHANCLVPGCCMQLSSNQHENQMHRKINVLFLLRCPNGAQFFLGWMNRFWHMSVPGYSPHFWMTSVLFLQFFSIVESFFLPWPQLNQANKHISDAQHTAKSSVDFARNTRRATSEILRLIVTMIHHQRSNTTLVTIICKKAMKRYTPLQA